MIRSIKSPARGEIWLVELDPVVGHEQGKNRPCLIISDDIFNRGPAGLVVIIPLTTQDKGYPSHVKMTTQQSGLKKDSFIICEQPRTISKQRIGDHAIGKAHHLIMDTVDEYLRILLKL